MADTATTTTTSPGTTTTSGLADWAAPYITGYLGQAQALAQTPYQAYQGPLTAGASNLQTQAFQGIGNLTLPNGGQYSPVGSDFTPQAAQQYMNPYLQQALNPQLDELRRQSQITQQQNAAKMTQAGAFGGSRQALMDTETQRNLLSQMNQTVGQGYANAYDKAAQQFNTDQTRKIGDSQFGANFGLQGLEAQRNLYNQMLQAGETQRGIESEGVKADYDEFLRQENHPYKQLEFQRNMISGLPAQSISSSLADQSTLGQLTSLIGGLGTLTGTGTGSASQLLANIQRLFGG